MNKVNTNSLTQKSKDHYYWFFENKTFKVLEEIKIFKKKEYMRTLRKGDTC